MSMDKKQLYCALKALNRIKQYLIDHHYSLDEKLLKFIRSAQLWLQDENLIPDLKQLKVIENELSELVIDFEDADESEAIVNLFLFAILTFIYAFLAPSTTSLNAIQEEVTQFFRNIAENEYMNIHQLSVIIHTAELADEIENLPLISNEKNQQRLDLAYVNTITDWHSIHFK